MNEEEAGRKLLQVIRNVAEGHYSNDIMEFTRDEFPESMRTVAEAMGMMMVKVEAREFRLEGLIEELKALNERIKRNAIGAVSAMAQALGARDMYTEGHTTRVADCARKMALRLGINEEQAEFVRIGGQLHDIGKIGFSDPLFTDHGLKNTPELVKEIVNHPRLGAEILKDLDFLGPALDYVLCHHERIDGSGYPRRLKGDDVPLGAQILGVADSFDAMTTDRPYQKGMSKTVAIEKLQAQAGKKFRADILDALAGVVEESE
ncbi:MAG: HD domain-containing protein [Deltaproteobacteria bacterium]|nr:HD domain-containing protein [Deltaproteobacteria bacterium]